MAAIVDFEDTLYLAQKALECSICLDTMKCPVSTRCGHRYCKHCIHRLLSNQKQPSCPLCKQTISKRSLAEQSMFQNIIDVMKKVSEAFQEDLMNPIASDGAADADSCSPDLSQMEEGSPVSRQWDINSHITTVFNKLTSGSAEAEHASKPGHGGRPLAVDASPSEPISLETAGSHGDALTPPKHQFLTSFADSCSVVQSQCCLPSAGGVILAHPQRCPRRISSKTLFAADIVDSVGESQPSRPPCLLGKIQVRDTASSFLDTTVPDTLLLYGPELSQQLTSPQQPPVSECEGHTGDKASSVSAQPLVPLEMLNLEGGSSASRGSASVPDGTLAGHTAGGSAAVCTIVRPEDNVCCYKSEQSSPTDSMCLPTSMASPSRRLGATLVGSSAMKKLPAVPSTIARGDAEHALSTTTHEDQKHTSPRVRERWSDDPEKDSTLGTDSCSAYGSITVAHGCPEYDTTGVTSDGTGLGATVLTEDDDNAFHYDSSSRVSQKLVLTGCGLSLQDVEEARRLASKFQGRYQTIFTQSVTHVLVCSTENQKHVADRAMSKYYLGIANHSWIVDACWVQDCLQQQRLLAEELYEIKRDVMLGSNETQCGPTRSRDAANASAPSLLDNWEVCCYTDCDALSADDLHDLIRLCGARMIWDPVAFSYEPSRSRMILVQKAGANKDVLRAYARMSRSYASPVADYSWLLESVARYQLFLPEPTHNCFVHGAEEQWSEANVAALYP